MTDLVSRLFFSLAVTLAAELTAAYIMHIREKRALTVVALINIATNPPLVFSLALIPFLKLYAISNWLLVLLEVCAFLIEGAVYKYSNFQKPFWISFVLNIVSFVGGLLLRFVLKLL